MSAIQEKTPFDRTYNDYPLIRILIHTDSLADDILNKEKVAISLLRMTHFHFLDIHFTPSSNIDVLDVMSKYGVEPCDYIYHEDFVTLRGKNFETVITLNTNKERLLMGTYDNSKLKLIDIIAGHSDNYDYFVVGKYDGLHQSITKRKTDISPEDGIELIRILLVNLGHFYVVPGYKVNEGYYYLYRFKKIFSEFQPAWSIIVSGQGYGSISQEVVNQFDSLSQRLEFICRATDKVSYYSLKQSNNDTQDNTLYHFGYLIMLITGIFDDLAWILTHIYKLRLNRMEVVLKEPVKKKRFYGQLSEKNKELYNFLTTDHTQNLIKMFYPIRDALQHRQFIKGMKFSDTDGYNDNVFALPEFTVDIMKEITYDIKEYGFIFSHKDTFLFDSHIFASQTIKDIAFIVNHILALIDWEQMIESLPEENIEQIRVSQKKHEEGLYTFLGIREEPLYF